MLETLTYPYKSKAYELGIPEILDTATTTEGVYKGKTGRPIRYLVTPDTIEFEDKINPVFHLTAKVKDRTLTFDLRRTIHSGIFIFRKRVSHPDLPAKTFVDYALVHFKKNGVSPNIFKSDWQEPINGQPSDNFTEFNDNLLRSQNLIAAANNTWTGRVLAPHGFSVRDEHDVTMKRHDEQLRIEALFRRS